MRKLLAVIALGTFLVGLAPVPARAGSATNAALALGSFAVFNQFFGGWGFRPWYPGYWGGPYPYYYPSYYAPTYYPTYYAPPAQYAAPAMNYAAPPPTAAPLVEREVVYPHGKYVLQGDGVTTAYRWLWLPNPPPPSPAPPTKP